MVQWINAGGTETKTEKTAFWRCQCFAPAVSAVACLISSWGLNQPYHTPNAALLRGRWHRLKDKNRSPFHGEKPLIENDFLKRGCTIPKRFCMVGTRYFASAPND